MFVIRGGLAALLIALVAGCQVTPDFGQQRPWSSWTLATGADSSLTTQRTLTLRTIPSGGEVHIQPAGVRVADGETAKLSLGDHVLTASKPGYRAGNLHLRVSSDSAGLVTVPLGDGFARVDLLSEPAGATLVIDGEEAGTTPFSVELSADQHELMVTHNGYERLVKSVRVVAGESQRINLDLQPAGALAKLEITTTPGAALLRMDGHLIGHSPLTLSNIPPGQHILYAELIENSHSRLSGKVEITLDSNEYRQINLQLDRRETSFVERVAAAKGGVKPALKTDEGKTSIQSLAAADSLLIDEELSTDLTNSAAEVEPIKPQSLQLLTKAVTKDTKIVSAESGADEPLMLAVLLADPLLGDFSQRQFVTTLFSLLRTGDGIDLYRGQRKVANLRKLGPNSGPGIFRQLADAGVTMSRNQRPLSAQSRQRLSELVFRLYRQRGGYPLLELKSDQNQENSVQVSRATADGEIMVLGTGAGFSVAGFDPVATGAGVSVYRISAADGQINISWPQRPGRLLVTASSSPLFSAISNSAPLELREKQIFRLLDSGGENSVTEITELSAGPEFRGWRKQHLTRLTDGHADGLKPLVEIGPHERTGQYQRAWIVHYTGPQGGGQRQLSLAYQVGSEVQQVTSDQFLRRDGFSRFKQ